MKQPAAAEQLSAKTERQPPPTGWAAIWKHLQNWTEIYLWVPMALLSIWLFAQFAYFLTGRRPTENADWIVGVAGSLVKCVFLIVLVSISRQQTGIWLTSEEQKTNILLAVSQQAASIAMAVIFAYLIAH